MKHGAAKPEVPFQGIPDTVYMDNGPVSRVKVFQSLMGSLGVRVLTYMPPSEGERRTLARFKGKVERPFRILKETHRTLYHFHEPADKAEANLQRGAAAGRHSPMNSAAATSRARTCSSS